MGIIISLPTMANAAATSTAKTDGFEISGWIPYWKTKEGTRDIRKHLDKLAEIHPFGFSVKTDGTLKDLSGLKKNDWKKLIKEARKAGVRITPTVMWSDSGAMHQILGDEKARAKHIKNIVEMVKKGKYDGVDIDYEGKLAATKDRYSTFLAELKKALGSKLLTCTVEANQVSNNYAAIGAVCDRVKIMTYDQRDYDLILSEAKGVNYPYMPTSDTEWVRKIAEMAVQYIDRNKLILGAPTYGHEYQITLLNGKKQYFRLWSINPSYGVKTAKAYNALLERNNAGEIGFIYQTGKEPVFNYVSWSDAVAIKQKIDLARELGLRGVAIFKFDGGEDPALWEMI